MLHTNNLKNQTEEANRTAKYKETGVKNKMKYRIPDYITGEFAAASECFTVRRSDSEIKTAVRIYYPCDKNSTAGLDKTEMYSPELLKELKKTSLKPLSDQRILYPECYEKAPHVPDRKFPLIVFNHGYGSYIEAHTFLCCDLASNGFIVASVSHNGDSMISSYDDGTLEYFDMSGRKAMYRNFFGKMADMMKVMGKKGTDREKYSRFFEFQKKHMPQFTDKLEVWSRDTANVINFLRANYSEWIDFSKGCGASGHSFGGATAYYLCHHSDDISCGVNIDGGVFGDYTGLTMKKPFLQICCEANVYSETKPLLDTEAEADMVVFPKMTHAGFTDAKFYLPSVFTGKMDGCEMHRKLADCHIEFFRKYLC